MYRYICQTETPEQYKRKAKKKKGKVHRSKKRLIL